MEFVIDDCDFSFFCNPYLLKLQFPYPCVDDERAKAVYDVDKVLAKGTVLYGRQMALCLSIFPKLKRGSISQTWISYQLFLRNQNHCLHFLEGRIWILNKQ